MIYVICVIAAIIVLLIVLWIKTKLKIAVHKANPIDTLNFQGCIGINLGDSWKFVLSRMLHLSLISKKKFYEYHTNYEHYEGDAFMEIGVGNFTIEEHFCNIDELEFCIRNGVLNSIHMTLVGEHTDVDSVVDIVKHKLSRKYGSPMENKDGDHFFMWMDKQTGRMIILDDIQHRLSLSSM